ncbi:hypothetical protein AQ610_12745 [Burkholderia humptydooensis]|nr:hypothetical protein AQ610_12745 [Burkholderia humptydooensis]
MWYRYDDADQAKRGWTYGVMYDRKNLDTSFAQWMLENPTPDAVKWVSDISDQTPAEAAAMTNETCSYMNFESDVANFAKTSPLMITVREEVRGVASTWVQTNAPRANLHVLGKHMMFWEHADQFNQFLDQFLAQFH